MSQQISAALFSIYIQSKSEYMSIVLLNSPYCAAERGNFNSILLSICFSQKFPSSCSFPAAAAARQNILLFDSGILLRLWIENIPQCVELRWCCWKTGGRQTFTTTMTKRRNVLRIDTHTHTLAAPSAGEYIDTHTHKTEYIYTLTIRYSSIYTSKCSLTALSLSKMCVYNTRPCEGQNVFFFKKKKLFMLQVLRNRTLFRVGQSRHNIHNTAYSNRCQVYVVMA